MEYVDYTEKLNINGLEKLHTKQLMTKLYNARLDLGCYCKDESSPICSECVQNKRNNFSKIKEILSTREHIPNKEESKKLRKERIKRGYK